ncbi:hypothetical protein [Nocardia blacklockiae]|uniref:hypothetical protein n=1 Tax=Nocardia blacklockiae TaxID=480036 RepID=UPI001893D8D1|nr:hypothetical protein [Nocardia blacklockiae]MBF6174313.1 hypothetical protein [Nocardia blacklockiae]
MPIAFETGGLQQLDPCTWGNPATGDLVTLVYIDAVPDLPAALEDIDTLRYRLTEQQAEFGCLIEAYTIAVAGQPALLRLEKFPLADGGGLGFTAGIVVPKATCSAILKIMCRETGRSGTREAAIVPKVGFQNMFRPHPYAPDVRGKLPYNVADDAQWDSQFPDHPLSRARRWISLASRTARIDPRFAALPPFTGPVAAGATETAAEPPAPAPSEPVPPTAGSAETAPIPSASAFGTVARKPAAPTPATPTPGSMPRLPASAAAYAGSTAAAWTSPPSDPNAVDFSQPPGTRRPGAADHADTDLPPSGGPADAPSPDHRSDPVESAATTMMPSGHRADTADGHRADAAETTMLPSGHQPDAAPDSADTTAMPSGIPLADLRLSAETTMLATNGHAASGSDASSAREKLPADETTAIPARPDAGRRFTGSGESGPDSERRFTGSGESGSDSERRFTGSGESGSDSERRFTGSGESGSDSERRFTEPGDSGMDSGPRFGGAGNSGADREARLTGADSRPEGDQRFTADSAETTALPSGRGHGASVPEDAAVGAGAETRPIPKS